MENKKKFRDLWGEFTDDENKKEENQLIPCKLKQNKFDEIAAGGFPQPAKKNLDLKLRSSLITQTIEVSKQTEMLQSLIETFSGKAETMSIPAQIIPKVDFPLEISADFTNNSKLTRPLAFVPSQRTPFTEGQPKSYPELSTDACKAALRKAISGLLITNGFTFSNDSALVLFTDAAEEYIRRFLGEVREVHEMNPKLELSNQIQLSTLEMASQNFTGNSLLSLHNYYKRNVVEKNIKEVSNFRVVFDDYNKLRKESEEMHVDEDAKHIANIIDDVPMDENATGNLNGHSNSFMNILDELMKTPTDIETNAVKDEPESTSN